MPKVADIDGAYDKEKAKKYLLQFEYLLLETYLMLSTNNNIRDGDGTDYQHLLVDEFQDTNPVQLEIIKCLMMIRTTVKEAYGAQETTGNRFSVCGSFGGKHP